jgi:hypothetical protein
VIVQRNADFGPYTKAGDDGSKIESMTVKKKITSRHGVDSRPLSEWLREARRLRRECRSGVMVKDGGALARANLDRSKGRNGFRSLCGWWVFLVVASRGAAAIMIVYRLHGER